MPRLDNPSTTDASPSADGNDRPAPRRPRRLSLPSLGDVTETLDLLRKCAISFSLIALLAIGGTFLIREVVRDRIVIEPVVVQLDDPKSGLNTEAIGHELSRHFAVIQRVGGAEWGLLHVAAELRAVEEVGSIITRPINLKEFGSPLNVTTSLAEIANMLGIRHPTLKFSITSRRSRPGYTSSVSLVGDITARASCDSDDSNIDGLMECMAVNAMAFVDPKIAAAYLLSRERKKCDNLDVTIPPGATDVGREERLLKNRRDRCGFERTQALIAGVLDRGRADHGDWAPYIFGQIHMARATAVPGLSDQLSELDQAIGKFAELQRRRPDSVSALTILIEAHVRKGVVIHERTASMLWSDEGTSPLQRQLFLAESTFSDAEMLLRAIPSRSAALAGIVSHIEGYLAYRRWMLMAHRRTKSGVLTTADGQSVELQMLVNAAMRYSVAEANGVSAASFYIEWGNILRAMGHFDDAAARYSRAAERDPTDAISRLNITVNYLDRVIHAPAPSDPLFLLIALGATSDYLAWASSGGPYNNLKARITRALARSGDGDDPDAFSACLESAAAAPPTDPTNSNWRAAAELKHCVDRAIDRINRRLRLTAAPAGAANASR